MKPPMIASLLTLLADPDHPDQNALFAIFADDQASNVLAFLAPSGSLLQIAAALRSGCPWYLDRWEEQTTALVAMITDPRCPSQSQMIEAWSGIPNAVGVLRDRTDTLLAWAQQQLINSRTYAYLAILLGPSDKSVRLLVRSPFSDTIGRIIRYWSMVTDPDNPTAW